MKNNPTKSPRLGGAGGGRLRAVGGRGILIALLLALSACSGAPARPDEAASAPTSPVAAAAGNAKTAGPAAPAASGGATLSSPPDMGEDDGDNDPFESFNRKMFAFNDFFDRHVAKPVARGYKKVTPNFVQWGVSNFFSNLNEPSVILNDLLQARFKDSLSDTGRFLLNSTLGLFGLIDVATQAGMPKHDQDLGQTLGVWGVHAGPYLVLPFFGPHNARDSVGMVGDWYTDPVTYVKDGETRWGLRVLNYTDARARLLGASNVLEMATDDPYTFVREAYRQKRRALIRHDKGEPANPFDEPVSPLAQ